jgi:hypothetical protein
MVPALSIMFSVINELIANGTAIRRGSTLPAARAVADIQMPFVNEKGRPQGTAGQSTFGLSEGFSGLARQPTFGLSNSFSELARPQKWGVGRHQTMWGINRRSF